MSVNPFRADPAVRERFRQLQAACGDGVRDDVRALLAKASRDPADNFGGVVAGAEVERITTAHNIGVEDLMLLLLEVAGELADPAISNFTVGAVGLEAETGNLVLGGNLEFPGANIANTVHGEGFVFARAFSRGTSIRTLAIGEAHPCAFCRQFLSEFAAAAALTLIDPLGYRLRMSELYPWPFDPAYLGEAGIVAGATRHAGLQLEPNEERDDLAAALTGAGRRSYTPYGRAPAAIALRLHDGSVASGAAIESVSFNPTMHPLPAAYIDLVAHGRDGGDIASAVLAVARGSPVNYVEPTRELLAAVAPAASLKVLAWA